MEGEPVARVRLAAQKVVRRDSSPQPGHNACTASRSAAGMPLTGLVLVVMATNNSRRGRGLVWSRWLVLAPQGRRRNGRAGARAGSTGLGSPLAVFGVGDGIMELEGGRHGWLMCLYLGWGEECM